MGRGLVVHPSPRDLRITSLARFCCSATVGGFRVLWISFSAVVTKVWSPASRACCWSSRIFLIFSSVSWPIPADYSGAAGDFCDAGHRLTPSLKDGHHLGLVPQGPQGGTMPQSTAATAALLAVTVEACAGLGDMWVQTEHQAEHKGLHGEEKQVGQ